MNTVHTAVIPVGGYGTRFLPMSKSIPKEMLPIGGKPVVLHVVEECVASGITEIIFVISSEKHPIETFFSPNELLDEYYLKLGKEEQVKELHRIVSMANYSFVFTSVPNGNGGSLRAAQHLLGTDPFVLVWGDEFMLAPGKPRIKQCIETFEKYKIPVISAIRIEEPERRSLYGIAELKPYKKDSLVKEIVRIVEKPAAGQAPSGYATHGAYVLTKDIFKAFDAFHWHSESEIFLTDLINIMKQDTGLLARIIRNGKYFDCGIPERYLMSQVEYALMHKSTRKKMRSDVTKLLKKYV